MILYFHPISIYIKALGFVQRLKLAITLLLLIGYDGSSVWSLSLEKLHISSLLSL